MGLLLPISCVQVYAYVRERAYQDLDHKSFLIIYLRQYGSFFCIYIFANNQSQKMHKHGNDSTKLTYKLAVKTTTTTTKAHAHQNDQYTWTNERRASISAPKQYCNSAHSRQAQSVLVYCSLVHKNCLDFQLKWSSTCINCILLRLLPFLICITISMKYNAIDNRIELWFSWLHFSLLCHRGVCKREQDFLRRCYVSTAFFVVVWSEPL